MGNKQRITLKNRNRMLDDLQRFVLDNKHVLLITSTPSISKLIKKYSSITNVYEVTGANNNEFKDILSHIKNKSISVLIMGIEQLINEGKRDAIIELYNYADVLMVDHIHHLSLTSFDYRPEYENISLMMQSYATSETFFYAYSLNQRDINILNQQFPQCINQFNQPPIDFMYTSYEDQERLALLVSLAKNNNVVCITHDYLLAELIANQLNRFIETHPIHRKVEETKKVAHTNAWQNANLSSIIITSDTIMPYPYPNVDYVIWLEMPVSNQQVTFYHQLFNTQQSLLLFDKEKSIPKDSMIHQFSYNNHLNEVIQCINDNPQGLTMREIERFVDGESYVLEKAMKGLKAYHAVKKEKLVYVIDQPFHLSKALIQEHETIKKQDYNQLHHSLIATNIPNLEITPEIIETIFYYPLTVRPKVLFPIGFFKSSLIKKEHQSEPGYVFYKSYDDGIKRAEAIAAQLQNLQIDNDQISITCLCQPNDAIEKLMHIYADKFNLVPTQVFEPFASSNLKNVFNPFHKMNCIMSQLKLIHHQQLKDITIIFADHADHFWHMGVIAKTLLENKLTKKVIVFFNQP